jgi:hypothetical protein
VKEVVDSVRAELGAFFRHLFPGVIILGAAYLRHPDWFSEFFPRPEWAQILVVGLIALALGNLAYVINRYGVLHVFELVALLFTTCRSGARTSPPVNEPPPAGAGVQASVEVRCSPCCACTGSGWCWLQRYANHVKGEMWRTYRRDGAAIRDVLQRRDSAAVFLLLAGELALLVAGDPWGVPLEPTWPFWVLGGVLVFAGLWLYLINRLILRWHLPAERSASPTPEQPEGGQQ